MRLSSSFSRILSSASYSKLPVPQLPFAVIRRPAGAQPSCGSGLPRADLAGENQPKPIDPDPHAFMANVDAALMEKDFDVAQRKWKSNVHHYRELEDFRRCLEVAEGISERPVSLTELPCSLNRPVPLTMPRTLFFVLS